MTTMKDLFDSNRAWARDMERRQPGFFTRLQNQQSPQYLWIGCADSRVPANEILGLMPGDIFVHRNVANVVVHSDLNCLSVMEFAIDMLEVKHIFLVGHYGCGGVRAALENRRVGLADNWLRHVQDVQHQHRAFLDSLPDADQRHHALCELNVLEQVLNICRTTVVEGAWARGQQVRVHAWVYGVHDGLLQDLGVAAAHADEIREHYRVALERLYARYAQAPRGTLPPPVAPA